ncbi:ribulose-phosphate 3-epimerase [Kaistia geumhonensis]|uniref:Ribulose-phosphate 3-epimerase n=1 Tax=Kaistia geumhonensis TaxID=410839 RepID=A0ABU0M1C8_9HYPH|nr:ribulose-phosphate 3-epimerase [Kaistia geumhonensis]MCX5480026.1 ribulose-phosphate 3-epimerase [Kaistia geumhonensis]MDQ0514746.1 ribulose-phosphate 3-epimerase [Kaistia geumhonensis]
MKPASGWFDALPKDRLLAEFSLWSADLARVADDVARVDAHVDIYHVDVADGHFSPALLYFPDLLAAVRKLTKKPLHVHLMVDDRILLAQIEQFAEAGADLISIHAENDNVGAGLDLIHSLDLPAGVVLQLGTPVEAAEDLLPRISLLTLLGTRIGVKGQGLDPEAPGRIAAARRLVATSGFSVRVAADGGIREHTVPQLRASGAETIVMGSLAFGAPDLAARIGWVHAQPYSG